MHLCFLQNERRGTQVIREGEKTDLQFLESGLQTPHLVFLEISFYKLCPKISF
jgi:hypothetical protein